jgi:hypothetical protein
LAPEHVPNFNSFLIKKKDLNIFFRYKLPEEFAIKPQSGTDGGFLNTYTRLGTIT